MSCHLLPNDDAKIHFFPDMAKIIFSFQREIVSLQKNIVIMTQSQMKETGIFSGVNLSVFSEEEKTILNLFARKYWKVTRAERISLSNSIYKIVLIKPTEYISHSFNLKREVVVVFSSYESFQPRSIEAIDYKSVQSLRVEEICCIVVSKDNDVENQITQLIKTNLEARVIVPFSYKELLENGEDEEFINNKIRKHFYSRDLFGIQDPLKKDIYFFGRSDIILTLVNRHLNNENSGLFGLRKTGKTSILYGIERTLDRKHSISVFVDCQTLHMKSWNQALYYIIQQLQLKGSNVTNKDIHSQEEYLDESYASDFFEKDILIIGKKTKKRILLIFDEIEHITFGTSLSEGWCSGDFFIKFWQSIRSAYQRNTKGVFSYLITGTNPRCVEEATINNVDNPIFMQFNPLFIPPFSYSQTEEMVNKLGGYMGLIFDESTCAALMEDFGGHPLLIRQMCSFIHQTIKEERPHKIIKLEYDDYKNNYYEQNSNFSKYAEMVLSVLKNWYPDEYQMLEWLSVDDQSTFQGLASLSPSYVNHLKKYNIVIEHNGKYYFNNESLKFFLANQNRYQKLHMTNEEKQKEISERRNKIEPQLRKIVRQTLKLIYGEEEAKKIVIAEIYGKDRIGRYMNNKYVDLFEPTKHQIFLLTLFSLIKKNWDKGFQNFFDCNKDLFDARATIINYNRKGDSHAAEIPDEQFQEFRGAMSWLEKRIDDNK